MFTEQDNELIQKEFESLRIASLKRCANKEEYEDVDDLIFQDEEYSPSER